MVQYISAQSLRYVMWRSCPFGLPRRWALSTLYPQRAAVVGGGQPTYRGK
jgi:hypothetical protein